MDYKKTDASPTTITRSMRQLNEPTGNLYESVAIISRRARQISQEMKQELDSKLSEFATATDNLEEIFENREQIEISKFYERLPKPSSIATQEFLEGNTYFRNPSDEEEAK
ncbi:MAG: RNA polymerase Rpb6 [Flavobacteriales bacterium]|nr:MAG: RNA polymerase Rpb6 [Flavobacteriales bacterium]